MTEYDEDQKMSPAPLNESGAAVPPGCKEIEVPETQCPRCGAWELDYDGFGVLAHVTPAYPDGCGYCSHPSIDDGMCGICGFLDEFPYANEGRLLIITANLGVPLIVRVTYDRDLPGEYGWACIWGLFKGRWITPDREKARLGQVLKDGDTVENDDDTVLLVRGGSLVEQQGV